MNGVRYRNAEESDFLRINDFYNRYYKINRSLNQYLWQFIDCPAGKAIYTMAVTDDEHQTILGIQAGIPIPMITSSGLALFTIKSEDSLIDIDACSKYRKKDIFKELYQFFIDQCNNQNVAFIWGFTHAINTLKRVGFEIPFTSSQMTLSINPFLAYQSLSKLNPNNSRKDKIKISILSLVSFLYGFKRFCYSGQNTKFRISDELTANTGLFRNMVGQKDNLAFIREDEAYLRWRTENNPYPVSYKTINFFEKENLVAQVIISKSSNGIAFIEQMLFSNALSLRNKLNIVHGIINKFRDQDVHLIRFMAFQSNCFHLKEIDLLTKAGFFLVNRGIGFMYKWISSATPAINPEDIYLSRLYTQGHN